MARRDLEKTELARARATLAVGEAHPRVAARVSNSVIRAQAPIVLALADPDTRRCVTTFAAAAFLGRYIAQAISGQARAELSQHVTDEARGFALNHRHLAKSGEIETDLATEFGNTKTRIDAEVALLLQDAEATYTTERACLRAALSEVIA